MDGSLATFQSSIGMLRTFLVHLFKGRSKWAAGKFRSSTGILPGGDMMVGPRSTNSSISAKDEDKRAPQLDSAHRTTPETMLFGLLRIDMPKSVCRTRSLSQHGPSSAAPPRRRGVPPAVASASSAARSVSTLQETLAEQVPGKQVALASLKKEHGSKVIGSVTIDQLIGGARGVKCMLWETSNLDPEEGIRFRGLTIPECQEVSFGVSPLFPEKRSIHHGERSGGWRTGPDGTAGDRRPTDVSMARRRRRQPRAESNGLFRGVTSIENTSFSVGFQFEKDRRGTNTHGGTVGNREARRPRYATRWR
ncbi:hypothetical protein THAOC_19912 [Thalassiosira oceanica]|uniref:Citrate synthase n=1 Tax=Thalassiosira oceanica TaxID=159749 RepID=K0SFV9_THAOC|nr:hypothetical protein THAOC_19912 [Thalassiosira oceanica]|eukprot:EJK59821.1 hypothetical protein THAOC_19912 [Thalassiosira oceanica]